LGIICWDWHHELGGSRRIENGQGGKKGNGAMKKTGATLVVFVIIPASQACLKGEYHERH